MLSQLEALPHHHHHHHHGNHLLNARIPSSSAAAEVLAPLKFTSLLPSAASPHSNSKEALSPLQSEGSTTTSVLTPPECSSSSFATPLSSIWSDYCLNASGDNIIPFMADNSENLIPTSSAASSGSSWWSSTSQPREQQQSQQQQQPHQQQQQQWNSFISPQPSMSEMEAGEWQLGSLATAPEVNEQLSKMAIESPHVYSSIGTALVDPEMASNPASWSSILMGSGGAEEPTSLDNTTVEGLQEALFSKSFMLKKSEQLDNPTWEFASALKASAAAAAASTSFELEDMGIAKLHQFTALGGPHEHHDRMNLDNWPMMHEPSATRSYGLDAFGNASGMDLHTQFDPSKIKQEYDPYNSSGSPMISMQHGLVGSSSVTDLLGASKPPLVDMNLLNAAGAAAAAEGGSSSSSRWGSKLPAMLSHVLPPPVASNLSKQFGSSNSSSGGGGRTFGSYAPKQEHYSKRDQSSMSQHSSITSQHSYDSKDSHPTKHMQMDESREVSSDPKRTAAAAAEHGPAEPFFKRPRIEQQQQQQQQAPPPAPPPQNPSLPFKATAFVLQVRKEKLGERITALQQLVSPFGKTDTASVLLEAIGYIKFLHEQVQVLSTPYMKNAGGAGAPSRPNEAAAAVKPAAGSSAATSSPSSWESGAKVSAAKDDEQPPRQDLRSRGLCLVPISCTLQVANNDNGADFWTPTIGGNSAK